MQDNALSGNLTEFGSIGNLMRLTMLDLYNNQVKYLTPILPQYAAHSNLTHVSLDVRTTTQMIGELPASIQNLTNLQYLYLDDAHYKPLRQYYCRQRLPQNGKHSYRIVRENYLQMANSVCEDIYDTNTAFNPLQVSGYYQND